MAKLLHEIEWSEPLVAPKPDTDYVSELVSRLSPWLGAAALSLAEPEKVAYAPLKLMGLAFFVTSQENACRYCYGEARAVMKIWGYSERQIQDLEHEASLADGQTQRVAEFARKLAKSNPSPAREDREALVRQGLSPEAVSEIAARVIKTCFSNRLSTFLALPPNRAMENLPDSFAGKVFGYFVRRRMLPRRAPPPGRFINAGRFAAIIDAAGNNHIAAWLRTLADGWLGSTVLSNRCKLLMMAVIARQLGSQLCEEQARQSLGEEGLSARETTAILSTLSSAALTALETTLLRWTRETVWYEPRTIQQITQRLQAEVGEQRTLEAIGAAAVCNSLARLSLVKQ
jgi:alkylhydroperoxidase family enzyme